MTLPKSAVEARLEEMKKRAEHGLKMRSLYIQSLSQDILRLIAALELCVEQRNHRIKMTDEFPRLMADFLNAQIESKLKGEV